MDFLLILLGSLIILIGMFTTTNDRTMPPWVRRSVLLAVGAVLIILGIMFRTRRYRVPPPDHLTSATEDACFSPRGLAQS